MKSLIFAMDEPHGPGYRLEAQVLSSRGGHTLELYSVIPGARNPLPHRLMQVTLPREAFERLADFIKHDLSSRSEDKDGDESHVSHKQRLTCDDKSFCIGEQR